MITILERESLKSTNGISIKNMDEYAYRFSKWNFSYILSLLFCQTHLGILNPKALFGMDNNLK